MGEPTGSGINFAAASVAATAEHEAETEHSARRVAETAALAPNVTCRRSQGRTRDNDWEVRPKGTHRVRRAQSADSLERARARECGARTRQEADAERSVLPLSPLAFTEEVVAKDESREYSEDAGMSAGDHSAAASRGTADEAKAAEASLEYPSPPARLVLQTSADRAVSQLASELVPELTQLYSTVKEFQAHDRASQYHIKRLDHSADLTENGFDRIAACVYKVWQQAEQATEKLQARTEIVQRATEDLQAKLQHNTEILQQNIEAVQAKTETVQQQTEAVQERTAEVQRATEDLQEQTRHHAGQIAYLLRWVEQDFKRYEAKATDMEVRLGALEGSANCEIISLTYTIWTILIFGRH